MFNKKETQRKEEEERIKEVQNLNEKEPTPEDDKSLMKKIFSCSFSLF
ncbi:MAG: hypothetical protein WCP39_04695 [Chlamydiota bacterium]